MTRFLMINLKTLSHGLTGALLIAGAAVRAADLPTPAKPDPGLAAYAASAEQELRGDILPFWLKHTRNPDNGGFVGMITANMKVRNNVPRGALLTSRILWTFSTAYRVYHDPAYLEMARYAYRDLVDHFWDAESGGLFWTITPDGKPGDTVKQIYGQVFGIYALAEYYRATGEKPALDKAIEIYQLVEQHARDHAHGGYLDTLNRRWERPGRGDKNLLGPAPKSQNSHIHILEAYTNLLRAWPDPGLRANQLELLEMTIKHIIDPHTHHLILFMKEDWTPTSEEVSYGHDIELSWLLVEAANVVGDPALIAQAKSVSVDIARATLAEGVDQDGGVVMEGGPKGFTNTRKEWWEQAEATVGFLNAYQLSGDSRFLAASQRSWDYIQAKFVDRVQGDWFNLLTREGKPISLPKVSLWKCPYHSSRCCFEVIERVRELTGPEGAR
jgi:cellobiose epimerase